VVSEKFGIRRQTEFKNKSIRSKQVKTLNSIANIALVLALAGSLSGCANETLLSSSSELKIEELSIEPIKADPEIHMKASEVKVITVPAPFPVAKSPTAQPVKEPSILAPVPAPTTALPAPAPAAVAPIQDGYVWIQETMAKYGVYPEAGTKFVLGSMPAGCYGADGCTQFSYYADTGVAFDYTITIVPGQLTEYLLFHEIGHARGIRDECGADNFARSVLGPVPGHYC
jgi:hypothetical protein